MEFKSEKNLLLFFLVHRASKLSWHNRRYGQTPSTSRIWPFLIFWYIPLGRWVTAIGMIDASISPIRWGGGSLRALAILTLSAIKHAVAIDLQRDKTPSALNISKYLRMVDILGKFDFTVCSILPHLISQWICFLMKNLMLLSDIKICANLRFDNPKNSLTIKIRNINTVLIGLRPAFLGLDCRWASFCAWAQFVSTGVNWSNLI